MCDDTAGLLSQGASGQRKERQLSSRNAEKERSCHLCVLGPSAGPGGGGGPDQKLSLKEVTRGYTRSWMCEEHVAISGGETPTCGK